MIDTVSRASTFRVPSSSVPATVPPPVPNCVNKVAVNVPALSGSSLSVTVSTSPVATFSTTTSKSGPPTRSGSVTVRVRAVPGVPATMVGTPVVPPEMGSIADTSVEAPSTSSGSVYVISMRSPFSASSVPSSDVPAAVPKALVRSNTKRPGVTPSGRSVISSDSSVSRLVTVAVKEAAAERSGSVTDSSMFPPIVPAVTVTVAV